MIGGAASVAEYFNGVIDDVRLYNRPLTAEEVTALATAPLPTPRVSPSVSFDAASRNVRISWPASGAGFTLESSSTVAPANWTPVRPSPAVQGNLNVVTQPLSNAARYYRLKRLRGWRKSGEGVGSSANPHERKPTL